MTVFVSCWQLEIPLRLSVAPLSILCRWDSASISSLSSRLTSHHFSLQSHHTTKHHTHSTSTLTPTLTLDPKSHSTHFLTHKRRRALPLTQSLVHFVSSCLILSYLVSSHLASSSLPSPPFITSLTNLAVHLEHTCFHYWLGMSGYPLPYD